jgi:hypothetical protein
VTKPHGEKNSGALRTLRGRSDGIVNWGKGKGKREKGKRKKEKGKRKIRK